MQSAFDPLPPADRMAERYASKGLDLVCTFWRFCVKLSDFPEESLALPPRWGQCVLAYMRSAWSGIVDGGIPELDHALAHVYLPAGSAEPRTHPDGGIASGGPDLRRSQRSNMQDLKSQLSD
jgi:hypothetical protein